MDETEQGNPLRCPVCDGRDLVPSQARWTDLPALIFFRRMVRCGGCAERFSTWRKISIAGEVVPRVKVKVRKKVRMRTRVKVREKFLMGNE